MARQIKWRLQFKSLNNIGCLVNIYEDGYTGSSADTTKTGADVPFAVETGVTELTGAAIPFTYEEDDSNDLTEFIRYKTGSINVIEKTYDELDGLYPTGIRQHFVEAFYGSERVFTGFMQCQEFDDAWVASPRELSFPIVSPLGLLAAFDFSIPSDHGLVTLGSLMQEVLIGLNPSATNSAASDYQNVIYPGTTAYAPWNNKINSTVIVPLNSSFKHYDCDSQENPIDMYLPNSYEYFVDGVCKCFGWMVHDTPSGPVFSQYDYGGSYQKLTVAGLVSLTGVEWLQQLSTSFNLYYSNVDDNAQQSIVMPAKKVTLKLEGTGISNKELTTKYATSKDLMQGGSTYRSVSMVQKGPNVEADYLGKATIDTGGGLYNKGTFPLAYGKIESGAVAVELNDSWVIKYDSSWADNTKLINAKFFGNIPRSANGYCLLKLKMQRGWSLQDMNDNGYESFVLSLVIKIDGKYADLVNRNWSSTIVYNAITINGDTGKVQPNASLPSPQIGTPGDIGDVDGIIFGYGYNVSGSVEIGLYKNGSSDLEDGEILRITGLSLEDPGHIDEAYSGYYTDKDEIVVGNNQTGIDAKEIDVPFYNYQRGENSICNTDGITYGSYPTLPYMFRPLHVLTERVKRTTSVINFNEYAAKWTYWINGWRWRMIAKNFNLRDDEYTITLARSSAIEP